jgi:two-component system sensor histidine kinase KdpD
MTRLGYGAVEPQCDWRDIREIIGRARRAIRQVLEGRAVELSIRAGSELVYTDAAMLEQVIVNLLENATKFSPPDTSIAIEGSQTDAGYDLSVCDRGSGIPFSDRERVFDLFRRAGSADQRPAGTGMGLAICRGFVEALGGTIRVNDRPGDSGTCFLIQLPQPDCQPSDRRMTS